MGYKWHRHDSYNPSNYNIDTLESKYEKKTSLQKEFGLEVNKDKCMIGLVTKILLDPFRKH